MADDELDPLIHVPTRLKIVATLAALPDGDTLSAGRLRDMTGLTPASQAARLRELGHAGYIRIETNGGGDGTQAAVTLTRGGRAALDRYAAALRQPPREPHPVPAPDMRASDADRDAAAVALGEHYARGRLTLGELDARLDAALTAITHGELSQVTRDLPDLTMLPAQVALFRAKRPGRQPVPASRRGAGPRHPGWSRATSP
jgi:DNA-binding MarR family transcriptional regulator